MNGSSGPALPGVTDRTILLISEALSLIEGHAETFERLGYRQVTMAPLAYAERVAASMQPDAILLFNTYTRAHAANIIPAIHDLRAVSDAVLTVVNPGEPLALTMRCFEAGADDVITTRTSALEMDVRMRALFRRIDPVGRASLLPSRVVIGDIVIDTVSERVEKSGEVIELSPTEYRLLAAMAESAGRVIPASTLTTRVWGPECRDETHYLRLYVRYLRQKIEDDPARPRYIVNRRGTGYALKAPDDDVVDTPTIRSA